MKAQFSYLPRRFIQISSFLLITLTTSQTINAALPNKTVSTQESINLELIDADIRAVIKTVSEATGKNFLIDPQVKGKITIVSNSSLEGDALYEVFLTALRTQGYTAVEQGNVITIVPNMEAKYSTSSKAAHRMRGDEQMTQVIRLKHIIAAQLISILRPLMPKEAFIQAYATSNLLILSDSKKSIQRVLAIIARMDKPNPDEDEIITLQEANAVNVLAILKETMPKKAAIGARLSADKRSNSIIVSGNKIDRNRFRRLITKLDEPVEIDATHHVVFLEHATAIDLATILEKLITAQKKDPKATQNTVSIIADEATNSLIISADLKDYESLHHVLKQLDIPRQQVMIEAIIAEVSIDEAGKVGVEWGATTAESGIASTSKNNGGLLGAVSAIANDDLSQALLTGGFSALISKGNIGIMLNAIKNDANVNILSAPKILTLNNKEAEIIVGETVPFVTGSFTQSSNEGATNPFQTVQREDIGLTLRIKPQINQGGLINLEVFQEISNVKSSTAAVDLITTKRSIKTNVVIANGHMLVLGGLMDDSTNDAVDAVPIMGDIPIIGWLFKTQNTETKKRTLMVFIKPTIISTTAEGAVITQQALTDVSTEQELFNEKFLLIDPEKERYKIQPLGMPVEKIEAMEELSN